MKRTVALCAIAALFAVSACKDKDKDKKKPATPKTTAPVKQAPEPAKPDAKLVERGAYIANLTGCVLCHTAMGPKGPDMANAWGGGLEIAEEFGTWRSPNISSDKETGIGSWTDKQIIASFREGKAKDGSQLFPIMPYMYYRNMSDDDAKALVAFLRTLKPIKRKVERLTDIKMPVPPPFEAGTVAATPTDDPVSYGGYLVNIMHCELCHTPFDMKKGVSDLSKRFAGGFPFKMMPPFGTGTIFSPNITPDEKTGIGKYTEAQIAASVKSMKKADNSPIMFPMMMYAQVWSSITDEDAGAIAKYMKSVKPIANKVPKSDFKPAPPPPGAGGPPAKK